MRGEREGGQIKICVGQIIKIKCNNLNYAVAIWVRDRIMNKLKLYSLTLYLLTVLTLYYSDLSGIKNTVVTKIELAHERQQKDFVIKSQCAVPTLPNDAFIKNHHDLISGNTFTLPSYLSQSSVGRPNSSLSLEEPQCRDGPSARAP